MTAHTVGHKSFLPLCVLVFATAILSVQFLLTKKLTLWGVQVFQIIAVRGAVQATGCLSGLVYLGRPLRTCFGESRQEAAWLSGSAFLGFSGTTCAFAALAFLNLGEMQVLQSITPVIAALFAWVVVGEQWRWNEFTSAGTTILGVLVVVMPELTGDADLSGRWSSWAHHAGVLLTVASCACAAAMYSCMRILGTRVKVHFLVVTLMSGVAQLVLGLVFCLGSCMVTGEYPVWFSRDDWLLAVAVGCLSISSQGCTIWGLQREKSALGSVVLQGLGPICAFILQIVFLPSEPIAASTLVGFAIIFTGLVVAVYGKWHREQRARKIFSTTDPGSSSSDTYHKMHGECVA